MSPTIFTVVVDVVVCHWESLVSEKEGRDRRNYDGDAAQMSGRTTWDQDDGQQWAEGVHQWLLVKAELLYANGGMVASTDPWWLQSAFDTLTGIFDRARLWTNACKTVGMV